MSKKIKLYDTGDCVVVSQSGFPAPLPLIGLVIEAELVEMDLSGLSTDRHYLSIDQETEEWLYRVLLPDGDVCEAWDYEIRPVNVMGKEYNNISRQA